MSKLIDAEVAEKALGIDMDARDTEWACCVIRNLPAVHYNVTTQAESDTLLAENARLRAALEHIADDTSNCISQCKTSGDVSLLRVHSTVISVQILARAALAGKE